MIPAVAHVEATGAATVAAGAEIVARLTQNYGKPKFGLATTEVGGATVAVNEEILLRKPFCQLLRFHRR